MPRPSRVLHVLKYYRPRFTGEGAFMERCTEFMQVLAPDIEHDLLVTVTPRPEAEPPVCSTLRRIHYLTKRPLEGWRHQVVLLLWFLRHLHRYDTIHVRTHADRWFLSYMAAKLFGRRLVLSATLDDSIPVIVNSYRPSARSLALRLFRLFDAFISVSPRLQQESAEVMIPAKCHLVPYGITFPRRDADARSRTRRQLGIPPEALVLIFVGALCERKDPLLLVRHLPTVLKAFPDTYLLLVGPVLEPDYVARMRLAIDELGIRDRVLFTDEVPDAHPYFQAADIMTFGSHQEGFGMVVPEAQANALPVVVRHLPAVNDLFVADGRTGFFFTDDKGFLDIVLRLAGDPALRARIGAQARDFVGEMFDMPSVARHYLELYGFPPTEQRVSEKPSVSQWEEIRQIGCTASIPLPRFHTAAPPASSDVPMLVTLIDAEEAFDWSRRSFSRGAIDVASMTQQYRAHLIFDRYGVVPTYMVDYPVASQSVGRDPLRELLTDGKCDIGSQLHPWVTPPFLEELTSRNSYPGNLPVPLEFEKLHHLTALIEDEFAMRPGIYRAGRFGAGPRTGDMLKHFGYLADSSVMPSWSFAAQEGPDFTAFGPAPFWIDADQTVLEIPSTAGFVGRFADTRPLLRRLHSSKLGEAVFVPALMSRLGLMERIRLTPEGITIEEARRLVLHLRGRGQTVFVMTYHTPSLVPGCTPYVRTENDRVRFLNWLDEFYDFFTRDLGGRTVTWRDVRDDRRAMEHHAPAMAQAAEA